MRSEPRSRRWGGRWPSAPATWWLAGETRYNTAVAISAAAFPQGAAVVYLARGDAFPEALAAGALKDGPSPSRADLRRTARARARGGRSAHL
jgi:hypothetical protein